MDSKKKGVVAWVKARLMRSTDDDLFMSENEWALHQWCIENDEVLTEFVRFVAKCGYSLDDFRELSASVSLIWVGDGTGD